MKKRKTYDGSFKVMVVMEYMEGKTSLKDIACKYQVHPNQIKNWKTLFMKRASCILEDRRQFRREIRMAR
ncbi:MAG: transposase [Syntrophaceae bacterium]